MQAWQDSQQQFEAGLIYLVQIPFLPLSGDVAPVQAIPVPHLGWVSGAVPPPAQLPAPLSLGTGYFQLFPLGQGSRAGHDLIQQLGPRWGHLARPGHSVSSAVSHPPDQL